MKQAGTDDVKRLYETYPYPYSRGNPHPDALLTYLIRGYFGLSPLAGWRFLDAGCGTGHKLAGLAQTYPKASFVGIELSSASAKVAQELMKTAGLNNVEVRNENIAQLADAEKFDFVQSFGVVHHLEDPQGGLNALCGALADGGILAIWVYHPLGESDRLIQRELLMTLWQENWQDMPQGQKLMELLGLELSPTHYGPNYGTSGREANALEANADAFMHPIVNAYRFKEAIAMLRAAGMNWAAVDLINLKGVVKLLNLSNVTDSFTGSMCLTAADLFKSPELKERFEGLPVEERLRVIELVMRPRGFQILAGRGQSYAALSPRIRGNVTEI